ncbi:MAG: AAA family ATPase [Acidimicrobiia bacterium]
MPRINQVRIRNYKSISQAAVELPQFCALVGPNGAGKSNFVDVLAFVRDCLAESVELAFRNRGGIGAVRRRSGGHPTHIGIRLILELSDDQWADYAFEISAKPAEHFSVARERCVVGTILGDHQEFDVREGEFIKPIPGLRPKVAPDRLALFAASATEEFRPVYDVLTSMRFYSIAPDKLKELQEPDAGEVLRSHGENAAAVLKRLSREDPSSFERLRRLLSRVVEGIEGVESVSVGQKDTLQFRQDVGLKHPWKFQALSMSDGTLRVLGLLLAINQPGSSSLIAIEEPEATVHPAVADLLVEVLLDASQERQILLTTHSPDILDHKSLQDHNIRVVMMEGGRTLIAPVSESSRQALREHLYTAGELLRIGELGGDVRAAEEAGAQLKLFGSVTAPLA